MISNKILAFAVEEKLQFYNIFEEKIVKRQTISKLVFEKIIIMN